MHPVQVFLSSAMSGELDIERAVLKTHFRAGSLGELCELWAFEDAADAVDARSAYLREVEDSKIAIFVFGDELAEGVVTEFNAAEDKCLILCYLRKSSTRTDRLNAFIHDRVEPKYKYSYFSDAENLCDKVQNDILDLLRRHLAQPRDLLQGSTRLPTLDPSIAAMAQSFCVEALEQSDRIGVGATPVDLGAHSLWGTVRPADLSGLPFERHHEIHRFDAQIDRVELNGAILPALNEFTVRANNRFALRVLLLHPDSKQAWQVHSSQRASGDPGEKTRFALSDIYLTLYVLRRLSERHPQLGLRTVRVMLPTDSMLFALTRIGNHALVTPYPRDQLLAGTSSYILHGKDEDEFSLFGRRLAKFGELWTMAAENEIEISGLATAFPALREQVDALIKRDPDWTAFAGAVEFSPPAQSDPTPFGTRTRLLTLYGKQVRAIWDREDPYPVALEINPANYCDQGCHWCISENKHVPGLSLDFDNPGFRQFVEDFREHGGQAVGWSGGGEPTNHPQLVRGMEIVRDAGLSQGLITHGGFSPSLVQPLADLCAWIRISVDTHDRDEYARKRGRALHSGFNAFDRVGENIRALVTAGANIGLNMNVARWNLEQVEALFTWAESLGVAYLQVRPTLVTPFPHQNPEDVLSVDDITMLLRRLRMLSQSAAQSSTRLIVSRDKFVDIVAPNYGRTYDGCSAHRVFVVLNANGDLAVCMYQMTDQRFIFGNIFSQSLEQIWVSEQRRTAVRFCSRELNHTVHQCQACCKGHEINKVLDGQYGGVVSYDGSTSPFI